MGDLLVAVGLAAAVLALIIFLFSRRKALKLLLVAVGLMIAGTATWSQVPLLGGPPRGSAKSA